MRQTRHLAIIVPPCRQLAGDANPDMVMIDRSALALSEETRWRQEDVTTLAG